MILILGYGRMGQALEVALKHLGHKTFTIDVENNGCDLVRDITENPLVDSDFQGVDLVFSCLPYYYNYRIAKACSDRGIWYGDLGGHIETSANILKLENTCPDLGLAPGYISIIAETFKESLEKTFVLKKMTMYCGGLSHTQIPPLNHGCTWSFAGLINEYLDSCLIGQDGQIIMVDGMDGYETLSLNGKEYEAFYTSGVIGRDTHDYGDLDICYKTLRPVGYKEAFLKIIDFKSDTQSFSEYKDLIDYYPEHEKKNDYVEILVKCEDEAGFVHTINQTIDNTKNFTAMQRATTFPVATFIDMHIKHDLKYNCDVFLRIKKLLDELQ